MYYLLSVLSGMVIAIMIAINGELAGSKGLFLSTVLIHVVGLVCVLAFMTVRKIQPLPDRGVPARFYLGGVIGVATVVCNSIGFGGISVSALTALGLLGQSLTSLSIDQFGWLGMPKRALDRRKWIGIAIAAIGILCMLSTYSPDAALPVAVSLLAGVTIVTSRTVNAGLAERSGVVKSTLYNYVTGLSVSLLVLLLAGGGELASAVSPRPWMYLGGVLGVVTVLLSNIIVARISSFYMTLLLFVGQVFAGVCIDVLLTGSFAPENLGGGLFVAAGLIFNLWVDRHASAGTGGERSTSVGQSVPILRQKRDPMPDVAFPARPVVSVVCPHCWTAQRSERDFCYHCGARFVYGK